MRKETRKWECGDGGRREWRFAVEVREKGVENGREGRWTRGGGGRKVGLEDGRRKDELKKKKE